MQHEHLLSMTSVPIFPNSLGSVEKSRWSALDLEVLSERQEDVKRELVVSDPDPTRSSSRR